MKLLNTPLDSNDSGMELVYRDGNKIKKKNIDLSNIASLTTVQYELTPKAGETNIYELSNSKTIGDIINDLDSGKAVKLTALIGTTTIFFDLRGRSDGSSDTYYLSFMSSYIDNRDNLGIYIMYNNGAISTDNTFTFLVKSNIG